jgi:hypothetical protein
MMVMACFQVMSMGQVCMMMGLFVMALLMCLRRFVMMFRGLLMMLGRLGVMFLQGARHIFLRLCPHVSPTTLSGQHVTRE